MDGGGVGNGPTPGSLSSTSTDAPVFPRLRLNRTKNVLNHTESPQVPGPSISQPSEDTQSTPRAVAPSTFLPAPNFPMATPLDTPAARLRALLSKSSNDWSTSRQRDPSLSEPDSDFDPPHGNSTSASHHHESLRQLFTRALRDDTPQKLRVARRNSIDLSEVDSASPRVLRVNDQPLRSRQRKSVSDEELEKASKSNQLIRADRYNTLRQRLENSDFDIDMKDIPSLTDQLQLGDFRRDLTPLPRHSDPSASTSSQTDINSLRFPSRLENDTNLLERDSEMQDAMKDMDSFESESIPPPPPRSTLALKAANGTTDPQPGAQKLPVTPDTSANLSKAQSTVKKPTVAGLARHQSSGSLPAGGSLATSRPSNLPQRSTFSNLQVPSTPSKPNSVISEADYRSVVDETEKGKLKERERQWNRPTTPNRSPAHIHERVRKLSTPGSQVARDSPHSLTARNLELHHRRSSSSGSLGPHSPASSIASFEQERDREIEHIRERNWNSPHPKWDVSRGSPSPTPSSVSERLRTLSQTTRPTPGSRPRYDSKTSSSSSRAASPAFSHSSKASVEEEPGHERERNWNASRPSWSKRNTFGPLRPGSPLHQSSSKQTPVRQRTQSPKNTPSPPSDPPRVTRSRLGRSSLSRISPSPPKSPPRSPTKELQLPPSQPDIVVFPSTPPRHSVSQKSKPPLSPPKQPDFSSGWKFPTTTASDTGSESEPREKGESTRPLASPDRPPLGSRIPVRAPASAVKPNDTSTPKETGTTRHRRSFSEFYQANGAIPPRVSGQTLLPPHNLVLEDVLHGSDEESPTDTPMSSTPRPGALPLQPSPFFSSLKELSPLRETSLSLANGGSPLKGSPKKGSPLGDSPPIIVNGPAPSLVALPRDASGASKLMLKTPSPPTDIPDIPDIPDSPSSDGSEQSTPVMSGNMTMMNTPKPPGAWMQTPAPALRSGRARSNTLPTNTSDIVSTPLPIQRGNSFPNQTPAPPGAWNGTPGFGSVGRKSALKVRFDVTSESETTSSPVQQEISLESIEMVHPSDEDPAHPTKGVSHRTNGVGYDEPRSAFSSFSSSDISGVEDEHRTPVIKPTPTPSRAPPSVRVVDAFGREVVEESPRRELNDVPPMTLSAQDATPSRKPSVRIVDAMGREVQQNGDTPKVDTVDSLTRMKKSISSLAREMDYIDSSPSSDDESDEGRFKELNEVSAKAQDKREKLKQTLHAVQSGEEDWKAKYGSLRASMRRSISFSSGAPDRPFSRSRTSGMVIGFIALAQIAFILYMLRLSHLRSQQLFLTTYYDPLFPDLYLHLTHPERFVQSTENVTPPWSIYHVPDTWGRAGWVGVLSEFVGNVTLQVSDWQREVQEHWRTTYARTDMPWPPQ